MFISLFSLYLYLKIHPITMIKECQNQPHFTLIQNNEELAQVCQLARQQSAVALDTEFMRVSTYYPKLGLIQLYDGDRVSLIDPLSITDFSPFVELLRDQQVTKILHACNEDLLVFLQEFDALPQPMMDTQIMARFLGFANSAGLAKLVLHYLGIEMDKGATRTNWLKRPLSPVQLQYAAGDVWYLLPVYQKMQIELAQSPWLQAARNLALSYVVKSDNLWKVAKNNPRNTSEMLALGLSENEVRVRGKKMLQLLAQSRRISPYDYPKRLVRIVDDPRYKKAIRLLQEKAYELTPKGLTLDILASKRNLEDLIKWVWLKNEDMTKQPDLLLGWRREIGLKLVEYLKSVE